MRALVELKLYFEHLVFFAEDHLWCWSPHELSAPPPGLSSVVPQSDKRAKAHEQRQPGRRI